MFVSLQQSTVSRKIGKRVRNGANKIQEDKNDKSIGQVSNNFG